MTAEELATLLMLGDDIIYNWYFTLSRRGPRLHFAIHSAYVDVYVAACNSFTQLHKAYALYHYENSSDLAETICPDCLRVAYKLYLD